MSILKIIFSALLNFGIKWFTRSRLKEKAAKADALQQQLDSVQETTIVERNISSTEASNSSTLKEHTLDFSDWNKGNK